MVANKSIEWDQESTTFETMQNMENKLNTIHSWYVTIIESKSLNEKEEASQELKADDKIKDSIIPATSKST